MADATRDGLAAAGVNQRLPPLQAARRNISDEAGSAIAQRELLQVLRDLDDALPQRLISSSAATARCHPVTLVFGTLSASTTLIAAGGGRAEE